MDETGSVKRIAISELPQELVDAEEELDVFEEGAADVSEEEDGAQKAMISSKDKMIKTKARTATTKSPGPASRGRGGKRGRRGK